MHILPKTLTIAETNKIIEQGGVELKSFGMTLGQLVTLDHKIGTPFNSRHQFTAGLFKGNHIEKSQDVQSAEDEYKRIQAEKEKTELEKGLKDLDEKLQKAAKNNNERKIKLDTFGRILNAIIKINRLANKAIRPSPIETVPGRILAKIMKFLLPKKTYERIIEPVISDEMFEYQQAICEGQNFKASYIKVRVWLIVAATILVIFPKGLIKALQKTVG